MTDPPPLPAVLVLLPIPGDAVPAIQRLKRLLKAAKRVYGLRAVCVRVPEGWEVELAERIEREE